MKNKITLIATGIVLAFSLTACSGNEPAASTAQEPQNVTTIEATPIAADSELVSLEGILLEGPVILTSVGQSADVSIVNTLFSKAGVDASMSNTLTDSELDGYKTLVLAIGGSSKGLGAAGIDENQELDRVNALITKAKADGIKILSLHIGGSARRGVLSDMFIPSSIENADVAIILGEGDTDNLMRDMLIKGSIPSEYVGTQVDTIEPIKALFGK